MLLEALDPRAAARKLRTDAVIDGEIVEVGRRLGVRLFLYARGLRRQIWAESLPISAPSTSAVATWSVREGATCGRVGSHRIPTSATNSWVWCTTTWASSNKRWPCAGGALEAVATGPFETHEMWGNLGDSLRHVGDREAAIEAYLRAAEIVEHDGLRGTATAADRIARAYYYTVLADLDAARVPAPVRDGLPGELEALRQEPAEPTASVRLALAWLHHRRQDEARAALARATETCPVYARHPDLAVLHDGFVETVSVGLRP